MTKRLWVREPSAVPPEPPGMPWTRPATVVREGRTGSLVTAGPAGRSEHRSRARAEQRTKHCSAWVRPRAGHRAGAPGGDLVPKEASGAVQDVLGHAGPPCTRGRRWSQPGGSRAARSRR
jgi:hypothetical protein